MSELITYYHYPNIVGFINGVLSSNKRCYYVDYFGRTRLANRPNPRYAYEEHYSTISFVDESGKVIEDIITRNDRQYVPSLVYNYLGYFDEIDIKDEILEP